MYTCIYIYLQKCPEDLLQIYIYMYTCASSVCIFWFTFWTHKSDGRDQTEVSRRDPEGSFADICIHMYTCAYICIFWFIFWIHKSNGRESRRYLWPFCSDMFLCMEIQGSFAAICVFIYIHIYIHIIYIHIYIHIIYIYILDSFWSHKSNCRDQTGGIRRNVHGCFAEI